MRTPTNSDLKKPPRSGLFALDRWALAIGGAVAAAFFVAGGSSSAIGLLVVICLGALITAYSFRFWSERVRDR